MGVPVVQMTWQPWCRTLPGCTSEGMGAGAIADRLGKNVLDVIHVMGMPEFKERCCQATTLDTVFIERLVNLWDLSEKMIEVAKTTADEYLRKVAEDAPEKELRSLRKDAIQVMADVLDRIGLKAPERVEQKITSARQRPRTRRRWRCMRSVCNWCGSIKRRGSPSRMGCVRWI